MMRLALAVHKVQLITRLHAFKPDNQRQVVRITVVKAEIEHLQGIGIRIEDDVLVTETGREVYTAVPKTVAEIEDLMRHD